MNLCTVFSSIYLGINSSKPRLRLLTSSRTVLISSKTVLNGSRTCKWLKERGCFTRHGRMRSIYATAQPGAPEEFPLDESYYRELEMDDDDLDAQTTFHADDIGVCFVLCTVVM